MTFDSTIFLFAFLPVSFILYYVTPAKFKNLTLVLISVLFYAWGGLIPALILLISAAWNYGGGVLLGKYLKQGKRAKNIMIVTVGADIVLLAVCRYAGQIMKLTGNELADNRFFLAPLGISFLCFRILLILSTFTEKI